MPIGPFGEIIGTTGTLECLGDGAAANYKSKVIAPRNPKLVKGERPALKMKPSQYMFQMTMDTEQKLANMHTMALPQKVDLLDMSETSHQKISTVNIDEPMFQPFPSEIIFQNFAPFETIEVPFLLRNNDKVPRLVKVTQADSPYFNIISPHNVGQKVGPGLPTTFKVQFTPEEKKDYFHEVVCITEREKFVVPIKAIGARAMLDFPDDVTFSQTAVKHTNSKTLLVRNIGNREAKFSLEPKKPFQVQPDNAVVAINESIQINVDYHPTTVGDHSGDLCVHYDTGEDVHIQLYGVAQDANVRLDKNSLKIENTFISMANQRTVTVSNRSDVIAHFRWSCYATQEEEDQQKIMFCKELGDEEGQEQDRFLEECLVDPSLRDKLSILSRTFHNRRKIVQSDDMLFADDVIKVEPVDGDIWPNSSMDITVIFKPSEAKSYTRTAFCDITGRESRLPLRIKGEGVGPRVQLSFDDMDMGNIFVGSTHTYEVVLINKGDIDAIFNLVPTNNVFGPYFQFNPSEGIVMPDGHQAIQISFSSAVLGDFNEKFEFQIDGSPHKLQLIFSGSVIGPTFHFDIPKLKFGTISYGFMNQQTCRLQNTALVPMTYHLRVPGDGIGESVCSTSEYDSTLSEAGSMMPPKEFEITPSSGTLTPQSEVEVRVELCSNTIKKYDLGLVVDVEGVGEEVVTLPISSKCVVPQVSVLTPILDYGRCFLRHPYEHHVGLQNETDLPAKYELVPQQLDQYTSILFTSPHPKGIVEPHSVAEVPLVITPQGLEELEITAHFSIFGNADAPLPVHVMCIGEGPVVHVMPLDLDWGLIPVLTDTPKIIRLSNESLIPAKFMASMVRPNSVWTVEPSSGEIPPEEQIELTVTACLDDCVKFQDKVQIGFDNAPLRNIPVTGLGHSTTIVTDPPMSPVLNLGPHFSKGPFRRTFTLTNRGRRHQSLVWSTEGFSFSQRTKRAGLAPINPKDMRYKDMPPQAEPPRPTFKLTPHRMELNPGESVDVLLEGYVDSPQVVREKMLCHAIIGRAGGKELVMKVQINCEFISPLLEFSTDKLNFRVDEMPGDSLQIQTQDLQVTNVSSLPLTALLTQNYPFILLDDQEQQTQEMEMYLGIGESRMIKVQFDPAFQPDHHIRILDETLNISYKEHPHVDKISLRGEVYFPNLEFEKMVVDFGCILNDTEVTRYINITNNSPMDVRYRWSFLLDDEPVATFRKPPIQPEEEMVIEDLEGHRSPGEMLTDKPEVEHNVAVEIAVEGSESARTQAEQGDDTARLDQDETMMRLPLVDEEGVQDTELPVAETEKGEGTAVGDSENKQETESQYEHGEACHMEQPEQESRPISRMQATPRITPIINPTLAALLRQESEDKMDLGVEEIFDILPLYGSLKPGETEQITLTFYGHAHIGSQAKAICEVEGGPTYELELKGEASLVQYRFDCLDIDYSKIMFDQVAIAELTLINTGLVGFEFVALGMDPGMANKPRPGVPVMIPHTGFIPADSEQTLTIKFLPGIPTKFHKCFQIQVAHFEPDTVNLLGEGVFPRISLDLPRAPDIEGHYDALVKDVQEILTTETKKIERPTSGVSAQGERNDTGETLQHENVPSDLEVQLEVERMVVQEFAEDLQELNSAPDILTLQGNGRDAKKNKRKNRPRPRLPDYSLDFGHVVLGTVRTHIVRATNTGWFPVSFAVDRDCLYQCGFSIELDHVRQLPGAPDHETQDFVVSFDPRGANLGLGEVHSIVPINIVGGPQVVIQMKANVTMPDMQISTDVLSFDQVCCGECKVITIQLHNHKHVTCEWNSLPTEKEKFRIDKHVPMHLRRKMIRQEKAKPRTFEMMPPLGTLLPGQRQNIQVKFMPTEERHYDQRITVRLAESSQRVVLLCKGEGMEPHLQFDHNLLEFGPILPHSAGDEQEVIIHNPCKFPIEVYNLEFDKSYLEEEKILRLMKGYDEYNTVLLPPRIPSDRLPTELLDYYEEQMRKLNEMKHARHEAEEAAEAARRENEEHDDDDAGSRADGQTVTSQASQDDFAKTDRSDYSKDLGKEGETSQVDGAKMDEKASSAAGTTVGVGELEITPVSAAIARHLGIDLTPEGKAARNRRGIAVVVHGAPLSGKTGTAVQLAKRYEAALLTVDGIVMEAIANGNTPCGLKARELCSEAAHRYAEELRAAEGGEDAEKKAAGGLSVEAVTAHTQGTVVAAPQQVPAKPADNMFSIGQIAAAHSVAHSLVSNRKTSTVSDQKSKDKHHGSTIGAKTQVVASSGEGGSQVPSSPPPLSAPIARRLSISASVAGEEGLMSCVLPEDLLIDILADRLMLNDCQRGVVFDGLDTLFSQNNLTTSQAILKAFNNRKYLYFITLKLDYNVMKEQEKKAQEDKEREEQERQEKERRLLEEMSEDEYDALNETEKAEVDRKRLEIKKERLRREMEERQERERREREAAEAIEQRLNEERIKPKKNRKGDKGDKDGGKKTAAAGGKITDSKSQERVGQLKSQEGKKGHVDSEHEVTKKVGERPDSHHTERGESAIDDSKRGRGKGGKDGKRPISNDAGERVEGGKKEGKGKGDKNQASVEEPPPEEQKPPLTEAELLLIQRFRTFEHSMKEISDLVDRWERSTGQTRPTTPSEGVGESHEEGHQHPPSGRKGKKAEKGGREKEDMKKLDKGNEKGAKDLREPAGQDNVASEGETAEGASDTPPLTEEEKREKRLEEGVGLPNIIIDCAEVTKSPAICAIETGKLPSIEEVLDGLGLGPRGPPIPPPASFAVVPYPVTRHPPPGAEQGHYTFIAISPDDPNIGVPDDKSKDEDEEDGKSVTPEGRKDDHATPTKGKGKDKLVPDKKGKRNTSASKSRTGRRSSQQTISPPPGAQTPASETDGSMGDTALQEPKTPKLTIFRWIVPAEGELSMKLRFTSEDLGQFDQTLNFEIMGTRRRYQLYCRGVCAFPTISREPRIVFPHRKKNKKSDEIVHKKYILTSETFEFGPLLVGKPRDKFKEGKYPENMEKITVMNTSPLEADISFCFLHDSKAETYILDPPSMLLAPGQSQDLSLWAYPKVPGTYEDAVVCCVKENPEPIIFKVLSYGVRPELEHDKKNTGLHFERVLLHRKDTKPLYLRNSTMLPVAWRLNGLENLGDDFSVSQESGVIDANSEFALYVYFRAMKPVNTTRKFIRLEVSDVDNIMGLVQTDTIQVHAEAYDVALDMSFPRGADGGIDFDIMRVTDEQKMTCNLKNKGKYDIAFIFVFEPTESCPDEVCQMFSVSPQRGTISASDRPTPVQVIFKSTREVFVKDQPILRCQVVEPSLGESDGEVIASIPIKISVKSVFSKYNIFPVNDINFGPMVSNSRKTRTFTIENKGERFEFKYTISKMQKDSKQAGDDRRPVKGGPDRRSKSRDGSSSGRSVTKPKRVESIRQEMGGGGGGGGGPSQSRLVLGMFSIFPAFSTIPPGSQQIITVDCLAESPGRCEEEIAIDITGRDPEDHKSGIPYKLIAESCIPSINVADVGAIFEEHRVCKNLSMHQHSHQMESSGLYGEDENKFIFSNVLVGTKAKARFKITNMNKVPCDVVFSVKPTASRHSARLTDIFEVEPARTQIAAHGHMYAVITFCPPSMQQYSAVFEAGIDGVPSNQLKGRNLNFEIAGEGNLPRISILKPNIRNKKGQPLLLFKRNLVGRQQTLPVHITNDGTLPSKVDIDLLDPDHAFSLMPTGSTHAVMTNLEDFEARKLAHTASVVISVGETASFEVTFKPTLSQRSQGHIRMCVVNNQYEDSIIQMVGEGYEDDITLENIHGIVMPLDPEQEEGSMADDDVPAAKANHIRFGDCFINDSRTLSFSMTNHSVSDCVRFCWPDHPQLKFAPQVGHLHAGRTKDMTITFKTDTPATLEEQEVPCKISRITFDKPMQDVADWDDRVKTVKWVDASIAVPQTVLSTDGQKGATPVPPPTASSRPAKKKIVETEVEPVYTEVSDTGRTVDLLVSAVADFCKAKCRVESIHFRDTLMLQTRVFEFQLSNMGSVSLDYNWKVVMETFISHPQARSVTFATHTEMRPPTAAGLVAREAHSRPATAESSVISEIAYNPFTVEPECGKVLPGKNANITVKFSPLDVSDYEARLLCSIPNLEDDKQGPAIGLKARSLMPYCHFELEDSDYIRSARRNPELRGPKGAPPGTTLDPNTRVIEMSNTGIGVVNSTKFSIVNPTNQNYSFVWLNEDEPNPKRPSDFKCHSNEGKIRSGKKAEVGFDFTSSSLDLVESFWKFVIPEQNISVPFLLVGSTVDPNITFDRSHLNFKSLLIGHEARETVFITNHESTSAQFAFTEASLFASGYGATLIVDPMAGVVSPQGTIPVDIVFVPNSDKEVNFNLVCNVKRKTMPLTLNVKAEGYSMDCLVMCEDSAGHRVELQSNAINQINFNEVEVNEKSVRNIFIVNSGKFNFDYEWDLQERTAGNEKMVSITPAAGGVMFGQRQQCQLAFWPQRQTALRGCELLLKISNGPSYRVQVGGHGTLPGLHFSFPSHNFGPCFIYRAGLPTNEVTLQITNSDKKEISVDCLYATTPQLSHNFEAQVIPPRQTVDVTFTFLPREAVRYHETITFEVNGLSKQSLEINGQGTEMKIEVQDSKQKIVKLGALRVGQEVKRLVPIINNSPAPIKFHLAVTPSSVELQGNKILVLSPTDEIELPGKGGTAKVEVSFKPKMRIPQFTEEVLLECAGMYQPLFVVQGSCQGIEILLDMDAIPFGAVVQKSSSTRKLVMLNTGDIGSRFRWDLKKFAPDFSIVPVEGYISAGMEVPFEVTFHPTACNNDIRYENRKCQLEGTKPLMLTLTGMCIGVPPSREQVHFTTHVRVKENKNIMVPNKTGMACTLKPIIDGEFWSGPETFTLEPMSTKPYEVTYHPLMMTHEQKKHTGSVFFPFPDGSGTMINLSGTSEPPKAINKIQQDVPCKTSFTQVLTVHNWLKKAQRFRVKNEMLRPDKLDPGTTIKGLDYIDVPGNAKRDYKLTFYAHKEGQSQIKISFFNEQTGEYQFYEVTFKAVRPGVINVIDLVTPVRQSVPYTLMLQNPLLYPVMFQASCNVSEVQMPNQLQVQATSEVEFTFEYQPLKVGESSGRLEFQCNDLGLYMYDLKLKATNAGPERAIYFRTCLGSSQTMTAKFNNFAKQKTDYTCKVENTDFHVDKNVAAAPGSSTGTEVAVEVTFEPAQISETRATLVMSSPLGGDYMFPLFGACVAPKPQGPFIVKAGSTTSISFRNVFMATTPFIFQVDNPLFHVTKPGENVRSRKDHRIVVGFDGNDSGSRAAVMGKLIVSCAKSAGGTTNAQWVYYLKGITP